MDRIVREHYPAERLPADLRPGSGTVRVTVERSAPVERDAFTLTRLFEEMQNHRVLTGDPVARVRALRSEWGERADFIDRIRSGDD